MTRDELKQEMKNAAVAAMTAISTLTPATLSAAEQTSNDEDKIVKRSEYYWANRYPEEERYAIRTSDITETKSDEDTRVKILRIENNFKEYTPNLRERDDVYEDRNEYDKKQRIRLSESMIIHENRIEAGPAERMSGYTDVKEFGDYKFYHDKFDKKGNRKETRIHSVMDGTTTSYMHDTVNKAKRGENLATNKLTSLDSSFYVEYWNSSNLNGKETTTRYAKYDDEGQPIEKYEGSINGENESYSKEKGKKYIEVSYEDGEYKGMVCEFAEKRKLIIDKDKKNGDVDIRYSNEECEKKELSERQVKRHIQKIRKVLDKKLKKETGIESLKEYADHAPETEPREFLSLGDKYEIDISSEQYKQEKAKIAEENAEAISGLIKGETEINTRREADEEKPRKKSFNNEDMRKIVQEKLAKIKD